MNVVLFATMLLAHGVMLWLGAFFFRRDPSRQRASFVAIGSLGLGLTVANLALVAVHPPSPWVAAIGLCAYATAIVLMLAARAAHRQQAPDYILSPSTPRRLVEAGPYRWVRHPFYLAYAIVWTAGAVMVGGQWLVTAGSVALVVLLVTAAAREEAQFAISPMAAEYRRYQQRTGRLLPAPWRRDTRSHARAVPVVVPRVSVPRSSSKP